MVTIRHTCKVKRFRKVKNKGIDKDISGNENIKEAGVAILFPDKAEIRTKCFRSEQVSFYDKD